MIVFKNGLLGLASFYDSLLKGSSTKPTINPMRLSGLRDNFQCRAIYVTSKDFLLVLKIRSVVSHICSNNVIGLLENVFRDIFSVVFISILNLPVRYKHLAG